MEGSYNPEVTHRPPMRGPRGYKPFKNPPQPHMCIQDSIKGTTEKLYINVMSWKQIANTKPSADLIPLYGGMQIQHGCNPNCNRPPLTVFAVMVNPEILKINGKNATNPHERDALVSLLCDFVEAMNPGLFLTKNPTILKDRDLAGELKDVWHAVQAHREREKIKNQEMNSDVTHKIYHIDGPEPDSNNASKDIMKQPPVPDNTSKNESQVLSENINNTLISNNVRVEQSVIKSGDLIKTSNSEPQPSTASENNVQKAENAICAMESKENELNKKSEGPIDNTEYLPKYDKQKQVNTKQIPARYNSKKRVASKQKSQEDNNQMFLSSNEHNNSNVGNKDVNSSEIKLNVSDEFKNMFKSLSLNDKHPNASTITFQNPSAIVVPSDMNIDNRNDIPFVDDYHEKICDQPICNKTEVEMLEKNIINSTKQPTKNMKVPISNVNDH